MAKTGYAFSDFVSRRNPGKRKISVRKPNYDFYAFFPIFLLTGIFLVLFFRLFFLQVVRADYYRSLSESNRTITRIVRGQRGIIFDRNKQPLTRNVPVFKITQDGKDRWLTQDEALSQITKGNNRITTDIQREYLYKDAFAHVLGYVGEVSEEELMSAGFSSYQMGDSVGKSGLEKTYEPLLHGDDGRELFETDAKGKILRPLGRQEETAGEDIVTTLSLPLQLAASKATRNVKKGAVVISDPADGGILALVSKPSFDPNLFTHFDNYIPSSSYKDIGQILLDQANQPLLNRAIGGVYPPGSTFKLVVASAALQNKAIAADTKIEDTGVLKVGDFSFGNWYFSSYGKKEGMLDVVGALKRSNDIFFYQAAQKTGVEAIAQMAEDFDLGQKLGIDLPGETAGLVPSAEWKKQKLGENWYLGDTYHFGIGQGYLLTTPLQVNFWTSVFANGGTLYKPHLLLNKKDILRSNFIDSSYIDLIRQGMIAACRPGGVAWPFFDFKVKNERLPVDGRDYIEEASGGARFVKVVLGCKTGTAETTAGANPHAWITVFAPFYNPEIVVTVLVENGGEGSNVAAPIAKKILEDYFTNK